MYLLKSFYNKTLKYNLINKFNFKNTVNIPKIKKIILNFEINKNDFKQLACSLLAFELITSRKGSLSITKKSNLLLKIHKGTTTGCKLVLHNQNAFHFLEKLILEVFPRSKPLKNSKVNFKVDKFSFSYQIHNNFLFSELEKNYYFFFSLPNLKINIVTNPIEGRKLFFFLSSLKLPLSD